ncbi:MAG: hypothetical protein QOI76_3198 [Frankiales bacterium]|nr:hypothetical protein [Frankiales bacterium]
MDFEVSGHLSMISGVTPALPGTAPLRVLREAAVVTRTQVLGLVEGGASYEEAGASLGIPAGRAYLIATGLPADGSMALSPEERVRPGVLAQSTQRLSNPPHVNPTVKPEIRDWVRGRAARELAH